MRFGLSTPNFGFCGEARVLAEIAREAEAAGWDGHFLWDHVQWPGIEPIADPWVALGAMAMRTERIRLGTMVTPIPRRRPWKLARQCTTLDHLTGGRVILGVGAGLLAVEFGGLGDESDLKVRAEMLDEGLEVLTGLWSGKPLRHHGRHYRVEAAGFAAPLQTPRIPIWVAASWPSRKPFRRASRWDGVCPIHRNWPAALTPSDFRELAAHVKEQRTSAAPFDVVCSGQTGGDDRQADAARVAEYGEAGATWWVEYRNTWETPLDELLARVRKGPPRG